jgi:Co/Zn/Cd efflux system component
VETAKFPKATPKTGSRAVEILTIAASGFALAAAIVGLAAEVIEHFRKPPAGPNERTKAGTAALGLTVLRTAPGLIRSARTLAAQVKNL